MTDDAARRFFDAIAGRYDREYALPTGESRARLERVLGHLPPAPARVLDLGVGTGRELTTLLDAGYQPTGVDLSSEMLARCGRRARPVPLVLADFWEPLPFDSGSFDAAVALHGTLAHPPGAGDLARLAEELARVVRPGGAFVAEVPSPTWLDRVGTDVRVQRSGGSSATYSDPVTGASIAMRLLASGEWVAVMGASWTTTVDPIGQGELLVAAVRAR
jgi:SAM-dependent methyltransferase